MSVRHSLMTTGIVATTMLILAGAATAQAPAPTPMPGIGGTAQPGTTASAGFVREFSATHFLASRLDGADVHTLGGTDKIADIADVIISDRGEVIGIILAYGGVAGIAQTYVAVEPAALRFRRVSDTETRVETTLTADQLRNAPKFDYSVRTR